MRPSFNIAGLVKDLSTQERFSPLWVDVENARETPDPHTAFEAMLYGLDHSLERSMPGLAPPAAPHRDPSPTRTFLLRYLGDLARRAPHPLVVIIDEADGLVGEAMVSFLTQLRQGYIDRDVHPFPASVMLIGQRQIRDYALRQEDRTALAWLGTSSALNGSSLRSAPTHNSLTVPSGTASSSPFNVTAEAVTLAPFTEDEVEALLSQHTEATGQRFLPEAVQRVFALGQEHPWLTNALADQVVRRDVKDRNIEVTAEHIEAAKETLILERRIHIDSLLARLREPRVRRILDPMLAGGRAVQDTLDDDFAYVVGLGLLREQGGRYDIANPIYREVIPRALSHGQQMQVINEPAWYIQPDGRLNMGKLMTDWQELWREDGHLAADGFLFRESGPHLMLMAFLQRIVNSGAGSQESMRSDVERSIWSCSGGMNPT